MLCLSVSSNARPQARLYEEAISTRKKTEALLQISELMSADLQSDKIVSKIVQAAYMLGP